MAQIQQRVAAPLPTDADVIDPSVKRPFYPISGLVEAPPVPNADAFAATQLGKALGQYSPRLDQMFNQSLDQQNKVDAQAARDQQIKTGLAYKAAVERGLIPAGASPTFIATWKNLDGQNQATDLIA